MTRIAVQGIAVGVMTDAAFAVNVASHAVQNAVFAYKMLLKLRVMFVKLLLLQWV